MSKSKQTNEAKTRGRRPDAEARAERREQIINAAQACFREKGFHSTSTAQISAAAGISSAGLYVYFSSKDELIIALIERELRIGLAMLRYFKDEDDFFDGLAKVYNELTKDNRFGLGAGLRMEIFAMASRSEEIANLVGGLEERFQKEVTQLVKQAQEKQQIDPSLAPEVVARTMSYYSTGLLAQMCFSSRVEASSVAFVVEMLRKALAPPSVT